jgi:hypothetical protein
VIVFRSVGHGGNVRLSESLENSGKVLCSGISVTQNKTQKTLPKRNLELKYNRSNGYFYYIIKIVAIFVSQSLLCG